MRERRFSEFIFFGVFCGANPNLSGVCVVAFHRTRFCAEAAYLENTAPDAAELTSFA